MTMTAVAAATDEASAARGEGTPGLRRRQAGDWRQQVADQGRRALRVQGRVRLVRQPEHGRRRGSAFAQFAGAKPKNPDKPRDGWTGGAINGHPLEARGCRVRRRHVGHGHQGDAAADGAGRRGRHDRPALGRRVDRGGQLRQAAPGARRSSTVRPARRTPRSRCGRRTSRASTVTARSSTPAWATWPTTSSAGATAAVIGDDYSFGWTSMAGFIAEFCAAGGKVTKRVFPPLNTTDYSSYAQQLPDDVDGTFVAVGGAGLIPFLKAYEQAKGPIDAKKFLGNVFWGTPVAVRAARPAGRGRLRRRCRHGRRSRHAGGAVLRQRHHRQVVQARSRPVATQPRRRPACSPTATS